MKSVVSLFSGCGGLDLGFEGGFTAFQRSIKNSEWIDRYLANNQILLKQTGFKTLFSCDIKPSAKTTWESYFSRNCFEQESIVSLVKKARAGLFQFPTADVVLGGFPCQDFSIAGKRGGLKSLRSHDMAILDEPSVENRGMLYYWMREVISMVKPKLFIAENVKGLASLGDVKNIISEDFRNIGDGYIVLDPQILHAGNYGVPQSRERIIFIGIAKNQLTNDALQGLLAGDEQYNPYPSPSHSVLSNDIVTAGDVLKDLIEPSESGDPSQQAYSKAKWYGRHCQGQIEINPHALAPTIRSEHHGNIEFRRLASECGGKIANEYHLPQRRLTVRECARLQTFPDSYQFVSSSVSASEAYRLIGNAVPPLLAYHLAQRLNEIWPLLFGLITTTSEVA